MSAPVDSSPAASAGLSSLTPPVADRYHTILHQLPLGFCLAEVLFDAHGTAVDYRFLETNPTFGQQTGWGNPVGRTLRELAPQHEAPWFVRYGQVARTGQPQHFE